MGKPAARITDMHLCPRTNPGPVPHVGGPIIKGCHNVIIGGMKAARVGDRAICIGPPDKIAKGAKNVLIGGKKAARMFDRTAHRGLVVKGCFTVLIGEKGARGRGKAGGGANAAPAEAFRRAAETGTPCVDKNCAACEQV